MIMRKYPKFQNNDIYKDSPSHFERSKINALIDISNELAESNRLKRKELELEVIKVCDLAQVGTFVIGSDIAK